MARPARSSSRNPGAGLLRVRLFKVEPWTGKLWSGPSTSFLIAAAIIEVVRVVVVGAVAVVFVVSAPP